MKKVTHFKGMTLFEIVIAIAIFGVTSLLLVEIMNSVNSTMKATKSLNDRLAYEQKFADNRLKTADSHGYVENKGDQTLNIEFDVKSVKHEIPASGLLYQINYNSENELPETSKDVNYRYMVFDYHESGDAINYDIPFFIPLEFEGNTSKYPIKGIDIYEIDDSGNVSNVPLSATLSCPEFDYVNKNLVVKEDVKGDLIMKENVERVHGSPSTGYQLIVNRKPKGSPNGNGSVMIVLRADITKETGNKDVDILDKTTNKKIGTSGNYPLVRFRLDYTAWTVNKKDSEKTESSFYYYPRLKFIVKSDYQIMSQALNDYEAKLYEAPTLKS